MANTITGRILQIGQTEAIPVPNSPNPFYKRELVLDASRFDQFTGRKFENYPKLEFTGNHCALLDQFPIGSVVTVSFVLSGRKSEKNGQVSFFTNVTGYKIEAYSRNGQQPQPAMPGQQTFQGQPAYQQGQAPANPFPATAPTGAPVQTSAQPFPPAVDENGNPICENPDDLPF
ncbi:MAG: DUF3127 domain-containing protein [Bacteroidaceae bacterium]|nr:DUF3127 domain-containing protein [Bacteroidaceae bacterium]